MKRGRVVRDVAADWLNCPVLAPGFNAVGRRIFSKFLFVYPAVVEHI